MIPKRPRDDRVLPETRWAALIGFFIPLPAATILWVAPDRTADLWAWTIRPELTPADCSAPPARSSFFICGWTVRNTVGPIDPGGS